MNLSELEDWGFRLGRSVRAPVCIALTGDLGVGKTTLARAICRGMGIRGEVSSPTYTLVNEHEVNGETVYHLDLYRLRGPEDLTNIGWLEIVNSESVVIVEWADRAGNWLPDLAVRIHLAHIPGRPGFRHIEVK